MATSPTTPSIVYPITLASLLCIMMVQPQLLWYEDLRQDHSTPVSSMPLPVWEQDHPVKDSLSPQVRDIIIYESN